MNPLHRILVIDDSEIDAEMVVRHLANEGCSGDFVRSWEADDVRSLLERENWDLILCDHFLPAFRSEEVLQWVRDLGVEETPFVIVSGQVDTETALSLVRSGANDFVFKNDLTRLVPAIEQAVKQAGVRKEKRSAETRLRKSNEKLKQALESLSKMQDQLVAVERFRALGQMSSGIAHDFNNALTKMLGTVEPLERESAGEVPLFVQLKTQIDDAAAVVRRLCDFYRQSPAKEESAVEIAGILRESMDFTRPKWSARSRSDSVEIQFRVEADDGLYGWSNASALREVLTNLIFNSCDALDETGGEIVLSSGVVGDSAEIEVRDTGCGMSPEVLSHCLEPLYSTKGENGTGLGLSIVNGVVQSFGGALRVESKIGKGTSVFLSFPLAYGGSEPQSGEESVVVAERSRKGIKVLVVDDEPMIATLVGKQLEILGHEATSMTDPDEALETVAEGAYDLVISDRSMPRMSGDDFARKVGRLSPKTKFAMASGYGDLMIANGELPEGVDIVLPKPVSNSALREAVEFLFSRSADSVALVG